LWTAEGKLCYRRWAIVSAQSKGLRIMVKMENCRRRLGPGVEFFCGEFHVPAGVEMALWGPSGCGKSTMLNLISGLLRPDEGSIRVDDVETSRLREGQLDRFRGERFGFVFQTFNLLAPFTALQNVLLGMRFSDTVPSSEWKKRATALLERVGLGHRLHSKPSTMSVGERQRVAIARALANKQKIVAADEPTGSLDPKSAASVMDLLLEMCREEHVTLLLVTHAKEIADRCDSHFDCSGLVREIAR
jgi:ABC-type lipoprotein export system ATPase subunit